MQSKAATPQEYLDSLADDRKIEISKVRKIILDHLPEGMVESMQYGMLGYVVPHSIYPAGYYCDPKQPLPFVNLASQKNYMSLYLFCVYGSPETMIWFQEKYLASGKKFAIGKHCLTFKKADDLALDVISELIEKVSVAEYIKRHDALRPIKKK